MLKKLHNHKVKQKVSSQVLRHEERFNDDLRHLVSDHFFSASQFSSQQKDSTRYHSHFSYNSPLMHSAGWRLTHRMHRDETHIKGRECKRRRRRRRRRRSNSGSFSLLWKIVGRLKSVGLGSATKCARRRWSGKKYCETSSSKVKLKEDHSVDHQQRQQNLSLSSLSRFSNPNLTERQMMVFYGNRRH